MAKQLNVNMKFNADSSQAKKELQSLQDELRKLVLMSNTKVGNNIADGLREATHAAAELSVHLDKATNTRTGNLDFSKLNQTIKASGKSLEQYGDQLLKLGPDGQQAFMKLTQAVVQAEVPFRRVNARAQEFLTTLANTARWQLSSSVLHGFMGALQSAYGYAQDLNESLNNIRIVTGNSIDDMAKFAQEANKAAKALSTTTTAYTDASLIYFQQGLSEADVKKRADVTIKLANVTRQSAEEVSDQMTAIWNNFYDGSKSLEHYADVLSALGAATASSTEEIAGGLEKFAAIAETIGLSYDYAAAALATLTSNTRESEEVVGTALKTIFARIQGLNLGETLDDGTTLNKYSQALATVGINIQDATGNLKDMDIILDEMGSKWSTLSRAQQTALAQTVAGTRQYNQLMALMANWNNGDNDSFKANLATAQGAEGTLQEQADIYADSWEAAKKRVTAAAEEMYAKLLNDEFFIKVLNATEKIIGFVDNLIDRLGGLKGLLFTIGTIVTKMFSDKIAQGLTNTAYNLQMMTKSGREKIVNKKNEFIEKAAYKMSKAADSGEAGYNQARAADMYTMQLQRQSQLLENADKMNDIEKETAQILLDQLKMRGELAIKSAEEVEAARQNLSAANENLYAKAERSGNVDKAFDTMENIKQGVNASNRLDNILAQDIPTDKLKENIQKAFAPVSDIISKETQQNIDAYVATLETAEANSTAFKDAQSKLKAVMSGLNAEIAASAAEALGASVEDVNQYADAYKVSVDAKEKDARVNAQATQTNKDLEKTIQEAKGTQQKWADTLTAGMNAALSAASALTMLGDITDTLSDPDTTGWEKFTRILMTVSMLIPTLTTMWGSLKTVMDSETVSKIKNIIQQQKLNKEKEKEIFLNSVSEKTKKSYDDDAFADVLKKNGVKATDKKGTFIDATGAQIDEAALREKYADQIKARSESAMLKKKKTIQRNASNDDYLGRVTDTYRKQYEDDAFEKIKKEKGLKASGKKGTLIDKEGYEVNENTLRSITYKDEIKAKSEKSLLKDRKKIEAKMLTDEENKKYLEGLTKDQRYDYEKKAKAQLKSKKKDPKAVSALVDELAITDKVKADDAAKKAAKKAQRTEKMSAFKDKAGGAAKAAGPYLAIAAGIAVAAGAIAWGKAQFNKYSQAAEDAAKSAESAAAAYQNASAAYDTFKSNVSNLKDAKDGMKGLVKGTLEYQEAVMKANEAAMALIDSNEDLQYTIDNSSGLIQIDEKSLEDAQKTKMKNMQKAQNAKLISAQNAKEAQTKADAVDLARSDLKSSEGGWTGFGNIMAAMGAGAASGALIGTGVGALAGPFALIGTAIGAVAGAVTGLTTGIIAQAKAGAAAKEEQKALEDLGEAFRKDKSKIQAMSDDEFKNYLSTELKIDDAGLIDSMVKNREEVEKLASQIAKNTDASYALNKQLVANALANNQTVQNSQFTEEIVATTAQFMEDDKAAALKKLEEDGFGTKDISKATGVNKAAEDAFAKYMEAAGLEGAELTDTTGTDKNRKFVYKDKDGNEHTVTLDDMKDTIASYNATEQAQTRAAEITKIYNRVGANDKQNAAKLNAAINNDFSKLDAKSMKGGEVAITAADLGITEAEAIALGYNSIDDFNKALAESADRAKTAWTDVVNTHTSSVGTAMESMSDLSGVSFKTLQSYGNMLEKLDQTQVSAFSDSMQALAEQADDQADALLNLASNIDWSQGQSALDQLNGQLYDMGINVEDVTNSDAWTELQNTINNMSFSVVNQNIDTLRDKLKSINEVAKNVKMGDVISDADYEKLTSVNGSLKQEFVMTADGYKYVGSKDLKTEAAATTKAQLAKTKDNNAKATAAYNAMINKTGVSWQNIADDIASNEEISSSIDALLTDAEGNEDSTILNALGKDVSQVKEWQNVLKDENASDEQKSAAKERLKELFTEATKLQNNYEAGLYNDRKAEELVASEMGITELEQAVADNIISTDTAEKFKKALQTQAELDKDSYREVNESLEKISENLSLIDKKKSKAFGKEHLDLIKQETAQLEAQIDKEREKIAIAKGKIATRDADGNLTGGMQYDLANDYGFTFNADGSISNYDNLYNLSQDKWEEAKQAAEEYNNQLKIINDEESVMLDLELSIREQALETYDAAGASLDKYTTQFSHHANVLDHYKNILGLMGKENDFTSMGQVLTAQAKIASDQLAASQAKYKLFADEAKQAETLMNTVAGTEAFDIYKKNWEDASEKAKEAQETMLSDLESWAQQEKAILENTIASLGHSLESALTGGSNFDEVATKMERASSLQENYLTTTNKIYETTKMMRTAQQTIDATTNDIAKSKLKDFITSTQQMQKQGKLSQYELDIQQAKYDLLVAEIALEEAKNAKSTVRLQRDASGNFGYVYTADASAVSAAQQQFDDAQNALYNKGLEGANDYSQKYQTTMQEMYDTFGQIQQDYMNGSYASESEYNTAMTEAKNYYYAKLEEYSKGYTTATSIDSSIAAEAWGSSFDDMMSKTSTWQTEVETYITGAGNAFKQWNNTVAKIAETSGLSTNDIATNIKSVTDASSSLLTTLIGTDGTSGLMKELKEGFGEVAQAILDAVSKLTGITITTGEDGTITVTSNTGSAATGGLTSAWGPEGKMLMVHENELILNSDQTNKFFDNLAIMENILSAIDSYAMNQQLGGILASPGYGGNAAGTLEQNVKIEASFPNVTDKSEIEEALNNLVNKASQYANRK